MLGDCAVRARSHERRAVALHPRLRSPRACPVRTRHRRSCSPRILRTHEWRIGAFAGTCSRSGSSCTRLARFHDRRHPQLRRSDRPTPGRHPKTPAPARPRRRQGPTHRAKWLGLALNRRRGACAGRIPAQWLDTRVHRRLRGVRAGGSERPLLLLEDNAVDRQSAPQLQARHAGRVSAGARPLGRRAPGSRTHPSGGVGAPARRRETRRLLDCACRRPTILSCARRCCVYLRANSNAGRWRKTGSLGETSGVEWSHDATLIGSDLRLNPHFQTVTPDGVFGLGADARCEVGARPGAFSPKDGGNRRPRSQIRRSAAPPAWTVERWRRVVIGRGVRRGSLEASNGP